MEIYIFRKENEKNDFARLPVDLIRPQTRSALIRVSGKTINLEWESEYTFPELMVDDILMVYIVGEDFSRGYVLPHLRDLRIKDLSVAQIVRSELDKIKQLYAKERDASMEILKAITEHHAGEELEDIDFIQNVLTRADNVGDDKFQELKHFFEENKERKVTGTKQGVK